LGRDDAHLQAPPGAAPAHDVPAVLEQQSLAADPCGDRAGAAVAAVVAALVAGGSLRAAHQLTPPACGGRAGRQRPGGDGRLRARRGLRPGRRRFAEAALEAAEPLLELDDRLALLARLVIEAGAQAVDRLVQRAIRLGDGLDLLGRRRGLLAGACLERLRTA